MTNHERVQNLVRHRHLIWLNFVLLIMFLALLTYCGIFYGWFPAVWSVIKIVVAFVGAPIAVVGIIVTLTNVIVLGTGHDKVNWNP